MNNPTYEINDPLRSERKPINGHGPWRRIEGDDYYLPGEVCEPIGRTWFWHPNDKPRSDSELLGMYLISRARNTNLLLNVPPDTSGKIPQAYITALQALRRNIDSFEG